MYIISKTLRRMPFEQRKGTLLKKSREEIELTTVFDNKNDANYVGNRLHAIVDEKRKECYVLASSSVSSVERVTGGFKTIINCDIVETIKYDNLNVTTLNSNTNYADRFNKSEVMFFGYDTRDTNVGVVSITNLNGIYFKAKPTDTTQFAFAEMKDGNNLLRLQRMHYSTDVNDWRWAGYAYPNGLNANVVSRQLVKMYGWDKTIPKTNFNSTPVSVNEYGKILTLEREGNNG